MEEVITKEIAKKLMELKGEVRGLVFSSDVVFILKKKGKEGVIEVEEEMRRLGYPLNYEKIKSTTFYPIGLRIVSLLVIKRVFSFSDEDIREMGRDVPKFFLLVRLYLKFFSMDKKDFFENASELWKKIVTVGQFNTSLDEENRISRTILTDFNMHPILCIYLSGIIPTFHKIITGEENVITKETKCIHRGDEFHEFITEHK